MQPIRLKLYYNHLSNFDFVDKELQTSNFIISIPELTVLNIQSKPNIIKNTITEGFILEVFGNQRFFIKRVGKIFYKNLFFGLTLRKKNLFLFLENCLNTIFLYEHKFLNLDNTDIEDKFYFYLNNNFTDYFILTSCIFKYSVQFSEVFFWSKKSNSWSFYLIPITKLGG